MPDSSASTLAKTFITRDDHAASWNQNRLTAKLGIEYPIVQGPLGGLSSQRLTAAVSNFGGLGSFGAHGLQPDAIKDVIAEIRFLTSKPFAMNLWVSMEDEGARTADENGFNRSLAPLVADLAALGAPRPTYKPYSPKRFEDQARVLLDASVPAFSFIFGIGRTRGQAVASPYGYRQKRENLQRRVDEVHGI